MSIWSGFLCALVVGLMTQYLLSLRGDGRSTVRPDLGTVELKVPRARVTGFRVITGCIALLVPLLQLFAPRQSDPAVVHAVSGCCLVISGGLWWLTAFVARPIVFSAEGIRVVGPRGWQAPWPELASIEAISPGADIAVFRFRTGRKVAVDSFFDGWRDLMRELPKLVEHDEEVRAKVAAAIRELNRWKTAAERY